MTTTPWPKAISFFSPSRLVARAGRLAAWHDMVTYLRSWWRFVALAYYLLACGAIPFVPFRSLSPPT